MKTKILVDGGDPAETKRIEELLGFKVDGQTTNPSLIAKNPEIIAKIAAGEKLTEQEELDAYKKIVESISPVIGDAGVSIEVFSDLDTSAETMFAQGKEMYTWIPNAYIKYPCTTEGLKAAKMSVEQGMRVNITLCFSQEQAAAVYAATKGAKDGVYVSPFVGRLDDIGENGMELIKNILEMYKEGDGHVQVLTASIRSLEHLLYTFALQSDLATVPTKVLEEWVEKKLPQPGADYIYRGVAKDGSPLREIAYQEIDLDKDWQEYNLEHSLTRAGIEKFVQDYKATIKN